MYLTLLSRASAKFIDFVEPYFQFFARSEDVTLKLDHFTTDFWVLFQAVSIDFRYLDKAES